jgi:hypothetical protein
MFYVKWFGQVMVVTMLMSIVALLVPPPGVAALMLILVIVWAVWLLTSLVRHLVFPNAPKLRSRRIKRSPEFALGTQVVLTDTRPTGAESFDGPPLALRVKAGNAPGAQRTCSHISARVPRDSRGRSFSPSFIYCRARRRLPAA